MTKLALHTDTVFVFCDASGNNKTKENGGIGIVLLYYKAEKHISLGQYSDKTTAYMEVRAVLESLKAITDKTKRIKLFSDNQYCVNTIDKDWISTWEIQAFIGRKNAELWKEILKEIRLRPPGYVTFHWVKGHQDKSKSDYHKYNCIADKLAGQGAKQKEIIE